MTAVTGIHGEALDSSVLPLGLRYDLEHDFATRMLRLEVALRLGGGLERKTLRHRGMHLGGFDHRANVVELAAVGRLSGPGG